MNWDQKIKETREYALRVDEMSVVFDSFPGASEEKISKLKQKYPFVAEEYLNFLVTTNGMLIDAIVLYGLENDQYISIHEAEKIWNFFRGAGQDWIPIGKDSSGDCFILCPDGRIRCIDNTMDDISEGEIVSDSFSIFLNDFLMGSRYLELYLPYTWKEEDETDWIKYLRSKGWL